ncbi:MAG: enoyl-CoA hydratase/isomerase family protein [Myxococcota bacterium]|jgi:enoyl-CoA hydratase/carnithine racemase|nr:enoyl-CoA hydratase [Deltaproteobacteria bacterium]MCP4245249.1 enoyl-CoA hydratase/isomerase family protein [bacterium]MDP6073989.1 enoyl-CoA hydratase/isomerase family protein [Myxococcota bacterium]MDP6241826.1 enoyl-CoA hydratase/isomerase family protein [Myxococcota bacterium]MDP7074539.1 enoyl-CoA hydratase/isomerase family protein [Myxococcota bacterium]
MAEPIIEVTPGEISTLTLKRPERRNALNVELMSALETAARSFADSHETRVVIVRGEGESFSAGADLSAGDGARSEPLVARRHAARLGGRMLRSILEIPQPTICEIQGVAIGGGACIATACDFRVAADDARIGYAEVRLGMNLMWNALPLCVGLIGPARTKRMLMTGALVPAPQLAEWGFVDECVPRARLEACARELAEELAALPPTAVQMIKQSVNAVSGALDSAVMHMDADQWLLTAQSQDFREGINAFREKRTPRFSGD